MGMVVVKTPDEKLAIFSTESDSFVLWDGTPEEIYEFCREELDMGREASTQMVRRGQEDWPPMTHGRPGPGDARWKNSIESIAMQHGRKTLEEVLQEMGFADYDVASLHLSYREDLDAAEMSNRF
jgi:hypothetical protein